MSDLRDIMREAAERVAQWPEWKRSDDVKRRMREFDDRVDSMSRQSTRAWRVLDLLRDGSPRSVAEIAVCLGLQYKETANTISSLRRTQKIRRWGTGTRKSHSSHPRPAVILWTIAESETP